MAAEQDVSGAASGFDQGLAGDVSGAVNWTPGLRRGGEALFAFMEGWPGWLQVVVVLAACVAVFWAIYRLTWFVLRRLTDRSGRVGDEMLVRRSRRAACFLSVGIGLAVGMGLASGAGLLHGWVSVWWGDALTAYIILAATWLVIGVISGADDMLLKRYHIDERDNLRARRMHTRVSIISRTLMVTIGVLGVAMALITFDGVEQIGASLLASAGIAGIAVGFAARPVLGNFIAGIQIAITQPIRLDDAVVIADEWGWVEEITMTYVVVRLWDQRRLIVPFSKIIEEPFQNWTHKSAEIMGSVSLYVDYSCPVDAVREELDRILDGHPKWNGKTKVVQVIDATEKTMQLRALVTANDSPTAWDLRCDVREKLIDFLRREHGYALPHEREERVRKGTGAGEVSGPRA